MNKYIFCLCFFILTSCSTLKEQTGEKPYFNTKELHCPPNTITYCTGPNRRQMQCVCMKDASIVFPRF